MNPRDGFFSEWAFLAYNKKFGSDFNLNSFMIDNRLYVPVSKKNVFAAQLYGQFTAGEAPFNLISLLGGENLMRGYYLGRFRDKNMIAGQVEYRLLPFGFSKRIGGSIFFATGQVFSEENKFKWNNFLPTGGAGLRFLVFPEKDIYTRLDISFTHEGSGVYLLIGEAF
jgi:outer membrane protein assembly factor BamA